jgi:cytochrome c oxidase subunit 1
MHFLGMGGEQRHLYDPTAYDFLKPLQWMNVLITFVLGGAAAAQLVFLGNFFGSLFWGARVGANPWEATTLEWTTASPAPHGNWPHELPVVYREPYEYRLHDSALGYDPQDAPPAAAERVVVAT